MRTRDQRIDEIAAKLTGTTIRIVRAHDGGPIRLIINGRAIRPTGRYPSYKGGGRAMPYEADHEMGALEISDVDKAVVRCTVQPHRLVIPVPWKDRPLIYFPDLGRDLADDTVEIWETKHDDDRRLRDPDYQFKLDVAKEVYRKLGWRFRLLKRAEIMDTRLYANAHQLATWSFADVPQSLMFSLRRAIEAADGALPFGKAAEIIRGKPHLYAMVIQRRVFFDLKSRIEDDTPVMWVDHQELRRSSPPLL